MEQVWLIRLVVVVGWLEEDDDAYLFCLWIHDHSARSLDWGSRDDYRGRTSVISDRNVHLTSQTLLVKHTRQSSYPIRHQCIVLSSKHGSHIGGVFL